MDIDANLARLRYLIAMEASAPDGSYAEEIQEYFEAMDDWLSRGGFLPSAWKRAKRST